MPYVMVMAALPNRGDASVQRRKVWLTPTTRVPCSNAAKTRKPLKFVGVPQTRQHISAVSRPKFAILWGHVEEVSMFNQFFPIVDTCLSCEDTARRSCAIVSKWRFLHPVLSASREPHISDMHSKFALRHTMCGSMVDIQSLTAEIRRGKKIEEDRNHREKYNIRICYAGRP